ncbi:LCP family protein [Candidatus Roizmanbacteria bacterium]|nr:LCP family protein [Candidatus Roizmanbacteria bacterium]
MKRKIILIVVVLFGLFLGGGVISLIQRYNTVVVKPSTIRKIFDRSTPTPTPDPLAPYSILLMGYGGGGHDGGYLTDTMIVAHVRPRDKTVHLISLPRDMWVPLPLGKDGDGIFWKVNAAYAFGRDQNQYTDRPELYTGEAGGGNLAKYAAEYVTGLPVRYFAVLSFAGFEESIDTLGGVDVEVPHTFEDTLYPVEEEKENDCGKTPEEIEEITATMSGDLLEEQFPCRYETISFTKGTTHMDGITALKFVRSRKSKTYGGDYNRSLRQLALIEAIKEKVISINFIPKIIPFMNSLTRDMQTDIGASDFKTILDTHPKPEEFTMETISLTTDNVLVESRSNDGQYILVPKENKDDWTSVHNFIQEHIGTTQEPENRQE